MINGETALVETSQGKVRGSYRNGLYEFDGIPYATPPTGERRWLPPVPHATWTGVLETRSFGPTAPQITREPGPLQLPGFDTVEPQSEDCLYLNIWTPGLDDKARPVMVWVHGGGFTMGSGSQPAYRGDTLASGGDVVIVTLNYRLGLLGFLNLNEVTGGKVPSTGNEGLLDQILALHWVRDNIAAFGGNPGNVTVFGESSGGMSIGCLLTMPLAQGLFQRGILESGTGVAARPLADCVEVSEQFLKLAGLRSDDIKGLRSLSTGKLLAIQQELTSQVPGRVTPVAPVVDGIIMPRRPIDAARAGLAMKIPILVGTNLEEMKLSSLRNPAILKLDEAGLVRLCQSLVPSEYVSLLIETYRNARARRGEPTSPYEILTAIQTDIQSRKPALDLVEAYCKNGQPAYSYIFTWKSPALGGILGACHTLEIGFVFGAFDNELCGSGPQAETLSRKVQDAWTAFARHGNPSSESLGEWPAYCGKRNVMMLGQECTVKESPYEEERQVWDIIGDVPLVM